MLQEKSPPNQGGDFILCVKLCYSYFLAGTAFGNISSILAN